MFKIAKLENLGNENIEISLITIDEGNNQQSTSYETLDFEIVGDNYTLSFNLNCKLEKLLEIPMNQTIDFSKYILSGTYLVIQGIASFDINIDIKITRYLKNKFIIFLTFFTDYTKEQEDVRAGMIEFAFNLDDYLKEKGD